MGLPEKSVTLRGAAPTICFVALLFLSLLLN